MIWLFLTTILGALVGIFIFLYYFKSGQFEDSEEIRYVVFWDDEENPTVVHEKEKDHDPSCIK